MSPNPVISSSHCDYNCYKTPQTTHKSNSLQDRKSVVNSNQRRNSSHTPLTKTTSLTHCNGQQQQQLTSNPASMRLSGNGNGEPRKLDRALSEPADRRAAQSNSSRYKTELCRPFEENGICKYGEKCQFAHGAQDLRTLVRHPKYKTELCRTFHSSGFCPYGPRCHFIHNSEQSKNNLLSSLVNSATPSPPNAVNRPKALSSSSLGSTGDISPPSSHSGSPTLMKSFDDLFHTATPVSPSLNSNTAFSFSQDFVSVMSPLKQQSPMSLHPFTLLQQQQPSSPFELPLSGTDYYDMSLYQDNLVSSVFGCSSPSPVDSRSDLGSLNLRVNPVSFAQSSATSPTTTGLSSPLDIGSSYGRLPFYSQLSNGQD